jgi:uncharacterized protein (DUF305 family)
MTKMLGGIAISGLLTIALAHPVLGGAPAPHRSQQVFEIRFMKDMIEHHQMALMTAMLVEERAVHDELRDIANAIIAEQEAEIALLQGWLKEWYGIELPMHHEMNPGHARMVQKLAALTGPEFEIEFMLHMILHHAGAVVQSLNCVKRAYHPELIELCERMAEMQLHEIYEMKALLDDWYGISRGNSHTRMGGVQTRQ